MLDQDWANVLLEVRGALGVDRPRGGENGQGQERTGHRSAFLRVGVGVSVGKVIRSYRVAGALARQSGRHRRKTRASYGALGGVIEPTRGRKTLPAESPPRDDGRLD